MHDAYALASTVLDDHFSTTQSTGSVTPLNPLPEVGPPEAIVRGLQEGKVVDLTAWGKIDRAEVERAKGKRKEREKFTRVEDMLAVL
jgi:adrenodoxin-NADP+ reductase